jgi:hypothetical protein
MTEKTIRTPQWRATRVQRMQRGLAGTRERVPAEMLRLPLSTYETVLSETPACWATSAMVTGRDP